MERIHYNSYFFYVILLNGFIFLKSGVEKLIGGTFLETLPATLRYFASGNPYPTVEFFLLEIAVPNGYLFGYLTMYGEVISGICLIIASIYYLHVKAFSHISLMLFIIGLTGAALLNDIFWLASGWTSPASETLNILMLAISLLGFVFIIREVIPSLRKVKK